MKNNIIYIIAVLLIIALICGLIYMLVKKFSSEIEHIKDIVGDWENAGPDGTGTESESLSEEEKITILPVLPAMVC